MLHRRQLLAVSALAVCAGWAPDPGVAEVRLGGDVGAAAGALRARLGIAVVECGLHGAALAAALDRGHVEAAVLDGATLQLARRLMGERLIVAGQAGGGTAVVRRVLGRGLGGQLAAALLA